MGTGNRTVRDLENGGLKKRLHLPRITPYFYLKVSQRFWRHTVVSNFTYTNNVTRETTGERGGTPGYSRVPFPPGVPLMELTLFSGIVIAVLAGLVMGTSPWPLKLMEKFHYEQFGFISMFVALFIIPWLITVSSCSDAISVFGEVDRVLLIKSNIFSCAWGIAQILAMLCFVRIGVALTYGILCGIGACVGVVTPLIIKASGQFGAASDITSKAGMTILLGVAVMLVGILFATLSGFGREKLEKAEGKTAEKSGGFALGLLMVVIAGVLSAGWGFAFVYSQGPIIEAMKEHGAGDFSASIAVWAFVLFGAAFVNVLYPVYLMSRRRSWKVLMTSTKDIGLSVMYGVLFFSASVLMANGMLRLGALGASVGVGITQGMLIVGGAALGFVSGEWRGITGTPRTQIKSAIAILIVAVLIMAYGNSL